MPVKPTQSSPRDRRLGTTYQLLKDGATKKDVVDFIKSKNNFSESYAVKLVEKASSLLEIQVERDIHVVVAVHARRYDKIYEESEDLYKEWIKYPSQKEDYLHNSAIIEQYRIVLKAMLQKERVYDLHNKDAHQLIADNYFKVKDEESYRVANNIDKFFDYDRINVDELAEIVDIMESAIEKEEEKVKAPDGSKETQTSTPPADQELEDEMKVKGMPQIQEYNFKQQQKPSLPPHLAEKQKSANEVRESLKEAMLAKIKKTYEKQDETRDGDNLKDGFKKE
jgi:hypothetical protein